MDLPDKVGEFEADPACRTEPPEYIDTPRMRLLSLRPRAAPRPSMHAAMVHETGRRHRGSASAPPALLAPAARLRPAPPPPPCDTGCEPLSPRTMVATLVRSCADAKLRVPRARRGGTQHSNTRTNPSAR